MNGFYDPETNGLFSRKELEAIADYINTYSPEKIKKAFGTEDALELSDMYHIELYWLHIGGYKKVISIPTGIDITDYSNF